MAVSKNQQTLILVAVLGAGAFIVWKLFGNAKSVHAGGPGAEPYGPAGGYGGGAYYPSYQYPQSGLSGLLNGLGSLLSKLGGGGGGGSKGSGGGSGPSGFGSGSGSSSSSNAGWNAIENNFLNPYGQGLDVNAANADSLGSQQLDYYGLQTLDLNGYLQNVPGTEVPLVSDTTDYSIPYQDTQSLDLSGVSFDLPSTDVGSYGGSGGDYANGGGGYDSTYSNDYVPIYDSAA